MRNARKFVGFLLGTLIALQGTVYGQLAATLEGQRIYDHVSVLASDSCAGRGPGTAGIEKAATYITDYFTMMGLRPSDMDALFTAEPTPPVAIGANCGVGASDILVTLLAMAGAGGEGRFISKGNCGIPEFKGAEIAYSGTPTLMAEYARLAVDGITNFSYLPLQLATYAGFFVAGLSLVGILAAIVVRGYTPPLIVHTSGWTAVVHWAVSLVA